MGGVLEPLREAQLDILVLEGLVITRRRLLFAELPVLAGGAVAASGGGGGEKTEFVGRGGGNLWERREMAWVGAGWDRRRERAEHGGWRGRAAGTGTRRSR